MHEPFASLHLGYRMKTCLGKANNPSEKHTIIQRKFSFQISSPGPVLYDLFCSCPCGYIMVLRCIIGAADDIGSRVLGGRERERWRVVMGIWHVWGNRAMCQHGDLISWSQHRRHPHSHKSICGITHTGLLRSYSSLSAVTMYTVSSNNKQK